MTQNVSSPMIEEIRQQHRSTGKLWEDPDFPATNTSIGAVSEALPFTPIWKRPCEIVAKPEMMIDGASRFDVSPGILQTNQLAASMASLSIYPQRLEVVLLSGQSLVGSDHCGAVQFNFWQDSEWITVIVDDRLPTYKDKPIFIHSATTNEFWSALLEKAYAKLYGSYENLRDVKLTKILEDLSGGKNRSYKRISLEHNMFNTMLKSFEFKSLMVCYIVSKPSEIGAKLNNGLIKGHPYSVTKVAVVPIKSQSISVELVRLCNPWGQREWIGDWSDGSDKWKLLTDDDKQVLGLTYDNDGEFWMSFHDFRNNFSWLDVCMVEQEQESESSEQEKAAALIRFLKSKIGSIDSNLEETIQALSITQMGSLAKAVQDSTITTQSDLKAWLEHH